MTALPTESIECSWLRFFQDAILAQDHPNLAILSSGRRADNPILDYLLPSLLLVKLVAVLDEAIVIYDDHYNLPRHGKKYRNSLKGRLELFHDNHLLVDYSKTDSIREKRNEVAHESNIQVAWDYLWSCVETIEAELMNLGFVDRRPEYEVFGERTHKEHCREPNVPFGFQYHYGLKEKDTGIAIIDISWSEEFPSQSHQEEKADEDGH